ncbi:hypothetical protein [Rubripirellula obstinata]|nr:hypothetical protein [Rubripirellula obstinata]
MTEPSTDSAASAGMNSAGINSAELNGPEITRSGTDRSPVTNRPADQSLLQSKTAILAILFLGTGALGIPLLWTNQRFSNKERFLWAAIATLYSLSLLLFLGWFVFWLKAQVMG